MSTLTEQLKAYGVPDELASELSKRHDAYPELLTALEQMELTFGDTAFAESEAGQDALAQARTLLATLKA